MGRKRKYHTKEEQIEAQRRWSRNYYERNKDKINKKSMEKYYELQKNSRSDNQSGNE